MHVTPGKDRLGDSNPSTVHPPAITSADAAIGRFSSPNTQPPVTANNRVQPRACALNVPCAPAAIPGVTWPRMDPGQEDGSQCVVCWRENPDVVLPGRTRIGKTARACAEPCARQLGFRPEHGWQGGRA